MESVGSAGEAWWVDSQATNASLLQAVDAHEECLLMAPQPQQMDRSHPWMRSDFALVLRRHHRHGHSIRKLCTRHASHKSNSRRH